jgi:hypothetical protein
MARWFMSTRNPFQPEHPLGDQTIAPRVAGGGRHDTEGRRGASRSPLSLRSLWRRQFVRFITAVEGLTVAYPTGNPPYGLTYTSPEAPVTATPFVGALTDTQYIQQFPVDVPP